MLSETQKSKAIEESAETSALSSSAVGTEACLIDNAWVKADNLVGEQLDNKYQIIELLGKGGMSSVYLARHQWMKKMVAIKVLRSDRAEDIVAYKRLQQESQACGTMVHSNLVSVHDFGITTSGLPFVVMDYVEGKTLSEIIKQKEKPEFEYVLDLLIQACDGLAYAHKHGVVHRDLKPGNIMVDESEQGQPKVKIVDFGIAKVMQKNGQDAHRLTQTGETFGSPMYMSPEQCVAGSMDQRSDIYSFGCVVYELFCGQPPFDGASMYEVIHKHINVRPPDMVIPELSDAVGSRLELITMKMLAKDPDERQRSMIEVKEDLETLRLVAKENFFARVFGALELWYWRSKKTIGVLATVSIVSLVAVAIAGVIASMTIIRLGEKYEAALDGLNRMNLNCPTEPVHLEDRTSPAYHLLRMADEHYGLTSFGPAMSYYEEAFNLLTGLRGAKPADPRLLFLVQARYGDSSLRCGNNFSAQRELGRALQKGRAYQIMSDAEQATLLAEVGIAGHRLIMDSNSEAWTKAPDQVLSPGLLVLKTRRRFAGDDSLMQRKTHLAETADNLETAARLWQTLPGGAKNAALCWLELASVHFDMGRHHLKGVRQVHFSEAETYYKKAIALLEKDTSLRDSEVMAQALNGYFALLWREHRYIEGFQMHQRAAIITSKIDRLIRNREDWE